MIIYVNRNLKIIQIPYLSDHKSKTTNPSMGYAKAFEVFLTDGELTIKNSKLIKNSFISITEKNNIRHPYVFVLKYSQLLHMPPTEKTCQTGVTQ